MNTPLVSVIVASYNYRQYLEEAVFSVLSQTVGDLEVLVVDDGSSDDSLDVAGSLARQDARVRVLRHADHGNHGLPATLQLGLAEAKGEFVAFLESDDVWTPDCLERRLAAFRGPDADSVGAVFNAVEPMPMPGADTGWFMSYVPRIMREHKARGNAPFRLDRALLLENKIPTFSCIMVRQKCLAACSFAAPVPRWLDWWLWMQVAEAQSFRFVPHALTRWRLHAASYNHKIAFTRYMADNKALWLGFRARFLPHFRRVSPLCALFLRLPFWARLAARFCMIASQSSPAETLRRIRSRLS